MMNGCLKDQTLLSLHDGEGTGAERTHLTECAACAARYRRLRGDLEAIRQVLRETPPPHIVSRGSRSFASRWLPLAVAVGLILVLVWGGARLWRPAGSPLSNEEIWALLGESSADLFLLNEAFAEEVWMNTVDAEVATALEAEWPCERDVESVDAGLGDVEGYAGSIPCEISPGL
jgi:hypothetical protein